MDSLITLVEKSPATSQSGGQSRLGTVLATAFIGESHSNGFPGSIVMMQQRKKMPGSQTPQEETDKHSVLCNVSQSWHLENAVKFLNSRSKDFCRSGSDLYYTSFISDREWFLVERGAVPLDISVSKVKDFP